MAPFKLGLLLAIPITVPAANEVIKNSPWTPELLMGLGVFLTTILAGVAKLILDVRAGNAVTEKVRSSTERILIVSDGRLTAVMKANAKIARALYDLSGKPEHLAAALDAEHDLAEKYEQDEDQREK